VLTYPLSRPKIEDEETVGGRGNQKRCTGAGRLEAVTADRFQIGPFAESEVPMLVAEFGAHGAGARSEAMLGVDLLKPYVLRIDYPRKRLWISQPAPPAP